MSSSQDFHKLIKTGIEARKGGKPEEARVFFQQATQLYPQDGDGWHLQGLALAQGKQYPAAIASLEKAIALAPQKALFYRNLAYFYQDQGDFERTLAT